MSLASTSHAAYLSIDLTELEMRVLEVIEAAGVDGCISDEVRACYPSLSYSSVTARFASLEAKGKIYRAGDTRPGVSGRQQKVMRHERFATAMPPIPPSATKKNPFLKGVMHAAKVALKTDPAFKGSSAAIALRREIEKIARR